MRKATALLLAPLTLAALAGLLFSVGHAEPPPLSEQVRQQQERFRIERAAAESKGYTSQFSPEWFQRADALAKQADEAATAGRMLEARDTLQRAFWNLPAPGAGLPSHVARIFGDGRLRHTLAVSSVAFSPDGSKVASAGHDGVVKIWDALSGRELVHYARHVDRVLAVAFSPDGKVVASAGGDKEIRLWDPATGTDVNTFSGPTDQVNSLAFNPDGTLLAVGGVDRVLRVFEVASGKMVRSLPNHTAPITSVAFSPDGKLLISAARDGLLRMFEATSEKLLTGPKPFQQGELVAAVFHANSTQVFLASSSSHKFSLYTPVAEQENMVFEGHEGNVTCLAISRDGKTLATGSNDKEIRLWDLTTGSCFRTLKGHRDTIESLAFSTDTRRLVSGSLDHTVRIWELGTGEQHRDLLGSTAPVWSAAFSPNGKLIVSGGADKLVRVWDALSGKELKTLAGHRSPVTAAVFSPDGKFILSASGDKTLKLWKADTFEEVRTFNGHTGAVTSCAFSPDGTKAVSGSTDRLVKVWDVATGRETLSLPGHLSAVSTVAWSEAGGLLASGGGDQVIRLWDAATGKPGLMLTGHGEAVSAVAFSRDGKRLASAGGDGLVMLWDTQTPAPPARFQGHGGIVSSVAFSGDGMLLASAGSDQIIKLWDIAGRQELHSFRGHTDWVTSVAFRNDDHFLVSASVDKTIKIWELGGRQGMPDYGHQKSVDVLAVSPDGKTLATGSSDKSVNYDRSIILWDLPSGRRKLVLRGHQDPLAAMTFTFDSKRLVSASDESVKIWDVTTGKEIATFPNPSSSNPVAAMVGVPQEQRFLAWVSSANVDVYDANSGKRLRTVVVHDNPTNVSSLCFSPDGEMVAVGGKNGSIRLWSIAQNKAVGEDFTAYPEKVNDMAMSMDKNTLVSVDAGGQVKVWNLQDRHQPALTLSPHKGKLLKAGGLAISPDGKRFATVGIDNVVKLWDRASGQELRQWDFKYPVFKDSSPYGRTIVFTPDGKGLVLGAADTTALLLQLP